MSEIKVAWRPEAAKELLALAIADQRSVADAVGELTWRLANQSRALEGGGQCITTGGYDVHFQIADAGIEICNLQPSGERR